MPDIVTPILAFLLALVPAVRVETRQVDPLPAMTALEAVAPSWSRCPEWYGPALDAGFSEGEWARLDVIIERESRCDVTAYNGNRATGDDSYCLTQLNMLAWARDFRAHGIATYAELFDGDACLAATRYLYEQCGWGPWNAGNYYCRRP